MTLRGGVDRRPRRAGPVRAVRVAGSMLTWASPEVSRMTVSSVTSPAAPCPVACGSTRSPLRAA